MVEHKTHLPRKKYNECKTYTYELIQFGFKRKGLKKLTFQKYITYTINNFIKKQ